MEKVQIDRLFKHELKQPVGDDMKSNRELYPQCRYMRGEHAHEHNGDDGNVIEASKNANDLPETLWCKL